MIADPVGPSTSLRCEMSTPQSPRALRTSWALASVPTCTAASGVHALSTLSLFEVMVRRLYLVPHALQNSMGALLPSDLSKAIRQSHWPCSI